MVVCRKNDNKTINKDLNNSCISNKRNCKYFKRNFRQCTN